MAQRREPAVPIFAGELSRATESYIDEERGEYSPTYLISDMGELMQNGNTNLFPIYIH